MVARVGRKNRITRRAMPEPYGGLIRQQPQNNPRGAFLPPTGSESVTTGLPPREDTGSGGVLGGMLAGKEAVDTAKDMYQTGVDANKGLGKMGEWADKGVDAVSDTFSGFSMPSMPWDNKVLSSATTLPTDYSTVDDVWTSLGGDAVGINSAYGSPEALSGLADPASGLLADSTGTVADASSTMAGATGGIDKLGAAGSAVGLGTNIYDMVDGGVNFGNVTGAIGSGILGASALGIGAMNAWNPVGWALLAASAADSIFDWS